jgi:hypothetical protein
VTYRDREHRRCGTRFCPEPSKGSALRRCSGHLMFTPTRSGRRAARLSTGRPANERRRRDKPLAQRVSAGWGDMERHGAPEVRHPFLPRASKGSVLRRCSGRLMFTPTRSGRRAARALTPAAVQRSARKHKRREMQSHSRLKKIIPTLLLTAQLNQGPGPGVIWGSRSPYGPGLHEPVWQLLSLVRAQRNLSRPVGGRAASRALVHSLHLCDNSALHPSPAT